MEEKSKEELRKEKKRETQCAWREKNREKLRLACLEYNATHKELRANYRATHKEESKVYREKNKEKLKRKHKEYYQKNREAIIYRTTRYHLEHKGLRQKYYQQYYKKIRLEVLARIDPAMKCTMCGCDDTRFLEVNHIKGGGRKEQRGYKEEGHNLGYNMILLIYFGKRGLEDLNLLCRACNSIDHLERVYGHTGLRAVWDKPVTNPISLSHVKLNRIENKLILIDY